MHMHVEASPEITVLLKILVPFALLLTLCMQYLKGRLTHASSIDQHMCESIFPNAILFTWQAGNLLNLLNMPRLNKSTPCMQ